MTDSRPLDMYHSHRNGSEPGTGVQDVRATIAAYGRGEIELPRVPAKTNKNDVRYAANGSLQHPYTKSTVASFLGWTSKRSNTNTLQPNFACETAFDALEMRRSADPSGPASRKGREPIRHRWPR